MFTAGGKSIKRIYSTIMLKYLIVAFFIMVGLFFVLLINEIRHAPLVDDDEDNFPNYKEEDKQQ